MQSLERALHTDDERRWLKFGKLRAFNSEGFFESS